MQPGGVGAKTAQRGPPLETFCRKYLLSRDLISLLKQEMFTRDSKHADLCRGRRILTACGLMPPAPYGIKLVEDTIQQSQSALCAGCLLNVYKH